MKYIIRFSLMLISISLSVSGTKLKAQNDPCDLTFFLWVEQPSIDKYDPNYFNDFYSGLADFVTCNAAKIKFNKVIVRFLNPGETFGDAGNPWYPSLSSPFLTDLVLKLPPGVEVFALPYIKTGGDLNNPQEPWTYKTGNPIDQAVHVIKDWNDIINGIDPTRILKGIAFDPEGSGVAKEDMVCLARQSMAVYNLNIKVGLTLPGKAIADAVNWGQLSNCYKVDESYLQVYNLYTKCEGGPIYVDGFDPANNPCVIGTCTPSPSCGSSIYLEALSEADPAQALFDASSVHPKHTFKGLLTSEQMNWNLQSIPAGTAKYVFPMFTVEAMQNSACWYPNTNDPGKCGQVDGFGTWPAADFLKFVNIFSNNIGNMTILGGENIPKSNYGIFQYSYIPDSWRPCNPSYGCDPLPVSWLDFKAIPHQNYVSLWWSTASEKNNDYFIIERSKDGKKFQEIGRVEGNKTASGINQYLFSDQSPLSDWSFYRLRQVDLDGLISNSAIVKVNYNSEGQVSIYPNPSSGIVEISFDAEEEENYNITVFTSNGCMIECRESNTGNTTLVQQTFDFSSLAQGLYLVKIQIGDRIKVSKLEKH